MMEYAMQALFAVGVIVVGKLWIKWMVRTQEAAEGHGEHGGHVG